MRIAHLFLIMILIMISSCSQIEVNTTEVENNVIYTEVTLEQSKIIFEEYIEKMPEYRDARNIILNDVQTLGCPFCWRMSYTFESDSGIVQVTGIVQEGDIKDVVVFNNACQRDIDCRAESTSGTEFVCENGVCKVKVLEDPYLQNCIDARGIIEERGDVYGSYNVCKFDDGTECEVESFFNALCDKGTNITVCSDEDIQENCHSFINRKVCAKLEKGRRPPYTIEWKTFNNKCYACSSSSSEQAVLGYRIGICG